MDWTQFKDPVSHVCLASAVVASWSFTQEVAGSSPFTVMTNIFVTVKHLAKTPVDCFLVRKTVSRYQLRSNFTYDLN